MTSYSGGTAEALEWWGQAGRRGATRVAVTSGGPLADAATSAGDALVLVPGGYEPRGALGLLLAPLLVLLEAAGAAPGAPRRWGRRPRRPTACATRAARAPPAARPRWPPGELVGRGIVLYGAGLLGAVAVRLKNQLNENAKAPAFAGALPEVAHNEVLGGPARGPGLPLTAVLLRDPDESPAERAVGDGVADELRTEGHPVLEWAARAHGRRARVLAAGVRRPRVVPAGERLGVDLADIDRLAGSRCGSRRPSAPSLAGLSQTAPRAGPRQYHARAHAGAARANRGRVDTPSVNHDVRDLGLAAEGRGRVEWADREMPVLRGDPPALRGGAPAERHARRAPACTSRPRPPTSCARWPPAAPTSRSAPRNPLSTQDDVAAALVADYGISDLRHQGRGPRHLLPAHPLRRGHEAADDDGRRRRRPRRAARRPPRGASSDVIAGTEETTTGVIRLRAMERRRRARVPGAWPSTTAQTKHLFDNRYGTGQSTIDGIVRATNMLLAGRTFVVARLRLVRARPGRARARHGRARDRDRGRPDARPGGGDGRLPRPADGRGRAASATSSAPRPATSTCSRASTSRS